MAEGMPVQQIAAGQPQSLAMAGQQQLMANIEGPRASVQLQFHDVSGTLFGHGHCQEPGPLFVRISVINLRTGQLLSSVIGAHPNAAVRSPGLRVMERVEEEGEEPEEEEVLKEVANSWCTSGELGDETLVTWAQGCKVNLPCAADSGILVELYREKEGMDQEEDTGIFLRQDPDAESTLIAWAAMPLFAKAGLDKEVVTEGQEKAEWSKAGLRILTGVQEKSLLAPPIAYGTDYDTVRVQQSKYADVLSCDGLATSSGGVTVILNAPLPKLRFTIEVPPASVVMDKLGHARNAISAANYLAKGGAKQKQESIFKYTDTEAWLPMADAPLSNELFAVDDGFDIYIDGARWLPDNVTLTMVTCYVANSKMQLYGRFEKEVDARSMNVRCPYYLARKEMRKDPSKDWDPTLTLLIQLNGLEGNPVDYVKSEKEAKRQAGKAEKEKEAKGAGDIDVSTHSIAAPQLPCVIVGFAVVNIFVDPVWNAQPANGEVREFVLHEGGFQLALHRSGLKEKEDLSVRALEGEMRRLCSTVLVRIAKAPRSSDGTKVLSIKDAQVTTPGITEEELEELKLILPPKPYHTQAYSSTKWCTPYEMETVLYPHRLSTSKTKLFSASQTLMGIMGQRLTLEDENAINECRAFEPERFNSTLKTMRVYTRKLFRNNPATKVLETKLSIPYLPDEGFLVSVDGIDNMSQDYFAIWTGALCSTLPQGIYYSSEGNVGSDVTVFYQMDFQADARSPRWSDGWMWFRNRDPSKGRLLAIIDVRVVVTEVKVGRKMKKLKNQQVVQLGFALLPIIGPSGSYVLSGNYRLPLYAMGQKPLPLELDQADQLKPRPWGPDPKLLERILSLNTKEHIREDLAEAIQDKHIHLVEGASVVCRLVDRSLLTVSSWQSRVCVLCRQSL